MAEIRGDDLIGSNLKLARNRAGLSLSAAADRTGVSKAMLGQIERGESSPTLATLWKLCKGLQLPLTALIGPALTPSPHDPLGAARAEPMADAPAFRTLFAFDPKTGCEVFVHDLAPHWEHRSDAHDEGVIEDVFVLSGAVEILVGSEWVRVERDHGLRFAADQPHGYRNPHATPSRFHNTIHYPARI